MLLGKLLQVPPQALLLRLLQNGPGDGAESQRRLFELTRVDLAQTAQYAQPPVGIRRGIEARLQDTGQLGEVFLRPEQALE